MVVYKGRPRLPVDQVEDRRNLPPTELRILELQSLLDNIAGDTEFIKEINQNKSIPRPARTRESYQAEEDNRWVQQWAYDNWKESSAEEYVRQAEAQRFNDNVKAKGFPAAVWDHWTLTFDQRQAAYKKDKTNYGETLYDTGAFLLDSFKRARETGLSSPSLQEYHTNLSSTFKAQQ